MFVHEARATRSICIHAQRDVCVCVCRGFDDICSRRSGRIYGNKLSRIRRTRFKVHIRVVEADTHGTHVVDITMLVYDPTGQHSCIRISRFNGSPGCNRLAMPTRVMTTMTQSGVLRYRVMNLHIYKSVTSCNLHKSERAHTHTCQKRDKHITYHIMDT